MSDGAVPTDRIRNVLLLGSSGVGKTALAERLLETAGAPHVRGGRLDTDPEERDRGHTLGLNVARLEWRGHRVNLLDTPGLPDAIGDAYPALRAADVALFVVDASADIQAQHEQLWSVCDELELPRLVFLNKLDRRHASYQRSIDALRERYGKRLAPVEMPVGIEAELTGVIDLLHMTAFGSGPDGAARPGPVPEERREQAERNRFNLVEAIVENDDDLLMRYLDGEVPDAKELAECFAHGIVNGGFFPVLCGSADTRVGLHSLLDFLVEESPSPADRGPIVDAEGQEHPLDGPTALWVAKTLSDPYVGHINVLRILTGQLRRDDVLTVQRSGESVRLHQLFALTGDEQTAVQRAEAGDVVAVAKLDGVRTGDVLTHKGMSLKIEGVPAPIPYHRVALEPASSGDEDKLSSALAKMVDEDPSLRVERDQETRQLVLHAYSESHVDVTRARMERKFGVSVVTVPLRLAYRETLRGSASGLGRHVKQSGGHGQYGIAAIEVEPLPTGSGFEFEDRIVGGVIPRTYIPSVESGVRDAMARGILTDYPVVDVKVALVDGKHHSVDSSDLAFQVAGSLAFRDAAEKAGVVLTEPVMDVDVVVPDDLTGTIMGDLSARRGRIHGTEQARPGWTRVRAHVPESEMRTYSSDIRSLTGDSAMWSMRYDHHDVVPDHLATAIVAEAAERRRGAGES